MNISNPPMPDTFNYEPLYSVYIIISIIFYIIVILYLILLMNEIANLRKKLEGKEE